MQSNERPPAVAGTFYPAGRAALACEVEQMLAAARPIDALAPRAIVAPHAGYMFSGPVAATAYARIAAAATHIRRVVLLGPSHFVPFRGIAASTADAFRTPLGAVPVDREALDIALAQPGVGLLDSAHEREHALETQLPFLQTVLESFSIVPLVAGDADAADIARVLEALGTDGATLVVISSDLSHFHDDRTARRMDRATADAIERLDHAHIGPQDACGHVPLRGLLQHLAAGSGRVTTLDLRTSADAGGPPERVVGYGAFAVEATAPAEAA